ncbi:MAG: SH3 domain-containing protein [Spirochaetota bacterium]
MVRTNVILIFLVSAGMLFALEGETVSVSVRNAQLRDGAGHLSPIIAELSYADEVEVLESDGDFYRVRSAEGEGFLHRSAVSETKIVLEEDGEDAAREAEDQEVALAGRGFNEQVEERYRSEQGLSFEGVDRMEARRPESEELRRFVEEGELRMPEEGS